MNQNTDTPTHSSKLTEQLSGCFWGFVSIFTIDIKVGKWYIVYNKTKRKAR